MAEPSSTEPAAKDPAATDLTATRVAVLCGGVGAARFLSGLRLIVPDANITAIVNTGDDMILHGLAISPDLDTCTYTLANAINPDTGWGLVDETWNAMAGLGRYGGQTWFGLGDRDLGTHLYRTQRHNEGATLTAITAEIVAAWELDLTMLPMTNDRVATVVTVDSGERLEFQRYFVERHHADAVTDVTFTGSDEATPAPGVLDALANADHVVIAPSNPFVSIAPILAIAGIRSTLMQRRATVTAVSPILGGEAVKGPAADMMRSLGHEPSSVGVAHLYREIASRLLIDEVDHSLADRVRDAGMDPVVLPTLMATPDVAANVARVAISAN